MTRIKNSEDILSIRRSGKLSGKVLKKTLDFAKVGVSTMQLDSFVKDQLSSLGAKASFKGYEGYSASICANVNDGVVHGLPSDYHLVKGDLLSVDLGVYYRGFHTDTAWTTVVGASPTKLQETFLEVGKNALRYAIAACQVGGFIGDVSSVIQKHVEGAGFSVVRELVGHGIGRKLHESPSIPGIGKSGTGVKISEGQALAVEVIYTEGKAGIHTLDDSWTIKTVDGSLAAVFEHTVLVLKKGPLVLTGTRNKVN